MSSPIGTSPDVVHVESCVTRFTTEKNGKGQIVTGRYIDITARNTGKC